MKRSQIKEYTRALLLGSFIGVLLALVFGAGFFLRDFVDLLPALASSSNETTDEEQYLLLDEVQNLINRHFLRQQPDYNQRQYGAIRGMLGTLGDRNTFFIDPPVAQSESDVLAGTYGGVGVSLQRNSTGDFILYPFPDSPAMQAGVQDGDRLIGINDLELSGQEQIDSVDQMLRGEVKDNNGVEITIERGDERLTFFIIFDVINIPSVLWRVLAEDSDIGYVQILRFTNRTPEETQKAVQGLKDANVKALVLDMRNNSGGLLQESIDVAGIFLDGGVIFVERTNSGEQAYESESPPLTDLPLIVLVNGGTASASELVAGAIQDRGRGILIGQTTFGKGTIQQIFPLSDASSIHITSAEWLTPDSHVIDEVGLQPDIAMIPDENRRDIEIEEAIRYLRKQLDATG